MVHQCTRCELRFRDKSQLRDHLDRDHHVGPFAYEPYRYPERPAARPLYRRLQEDRPDAVRYLVVGNQTLGTPAVLDEIRRLAAQEPATFYVVAPATPSGHLVKGWDGSLTDSGMPVAASDSVRLEHPFDRAGLAQARWRLRRVLDVLGDEGLAVHGAVADPNPVTAVAQALARERCDRIVVATLPAPISRWVQANLVERLAHRFGLPVSAIEVSIDADAIEVSMDADAIDPGATRGVGQPR